MANDEHSLARSMRSVDGTLYEQDIFPEQTVSKTGNTFAEHPMSAKNKKPRNDPELYIHLFDYTGKYKNINTAIVASFLVLLTGTNTFCSLKTTFSVGSRRA